ncbi:MAG: hypothetical protein IJA30_04885 [Bacilli bacterium]|nr:hypothetical protein [Bacilli bacterium]
MTKGDYIKLINENYENESKEMLLKQVELFFTENNFSKNKYNIGDNVVLKKGTYIHGIPGYLDNFDWIIENGFIGNDFTNRSVANKIKSSIGMWKIKEDILLKDYVNNYSGFTIVYTIGRGPGSKEVSELIPYHKFDEYTEKINDDENIWMYWGDQTKEVRFLPSLVANKRQLAFILNMENALAKELVKLDVWDPSLKEETVKPFIDYRYFEKFLKERLNRNALTTDRETAIMFGLPPSLIEGIFVGRILEKDKDALAYIKSKLPDCYICNLDGKVIIGN